MRGVGYAHPLRYETFRPLLTSPQIENRTTAKLVEQEQKLTTLLQISGCFDLNIMRRSNNQLEPVHPDM